MDLYVLAEEQLARMGAAWRLLPGQRYARHALCPCSAGYRASLSVLEGIAPTPRLAVLALLHRLAKHLAAASWLHAEPYPIPAATLDALSEAYEALGGDWRTA